MIVLTPVQRHSKEVIEWLMSDSWKDKRVGRTYLMSVILIEKALEKPGNWIPIWDHGPYHPRKEDFMFRYIKNIVEEHYPEFKIKIHQLNKSFCLEKRVKITHIAYHKYPKVREALQTIANELGIAIFKKESPRQYSSPFDSPFNWSGFDYDNNPFYEELKKKKAEEEKRTAERQAREKHEREQERVRQEKTKKERAGGFRAETKEGQTYEGFKGHYTVYDEVKYTVNEDFNSIFDEILKSLFKAQTQSQQRPFKSPLSYTFKCDICGKDSEGLAYPIKTKEGEKGVCQQCYKINSNPEDWMRK